MEQEIKTFEIPEGRMPELERRMARLSRLAAKLNAPAPEMREVGATNRVYTRQQEGDGSWFWHHHERQTGESVNECVSRVAKRFELAVHVIRFLTIEVSGPAPKLAGWYFLAKLEHTEAGTMIQKLSDQPVPEQYRNVPPLCDHCNLDRKRKDTYVVSDGEQYKQVGRTCLKDFTGHPSPEYVANLCSFMEFFAAIGEFADEDFFKEPGNFAEPRYSLEQILRYSASLTRQHGYISRQKADIESRLSTGQTVYWCLSTPKDQKAMEEQVTEPDEKMARDAMAWAKLIEANPGDDYLWNLSVLAELEVVPRKRVGLAASIIIAYQRAMDLEIKNAAKKASEHFGAKKDKVTIIAVLTKSAATDGVYGGYRHEFLTTEGNVVLWWASNSLSVIDGSHYPEIGDTLQVYGTIKGHTEFHGIKQTLLTRCKVLSLVATQQEAA